MAKRIWKSRAFFIQADTRGSLAILLCLALILCIFAGFGESFAQGIHHPFAVGANEGAVGSTTGLRGWILAQESGFYRMLTGAIRAAKENGAAAWVLAGLSFVYGIFHAAGPGHGKAVIASYMLANEKALWRGLVISLCAALMQALVAIGIVGIAALILRATAGEMTEAAHWLEIASYTGIVALGAALVVSKGMALVAALRMASMPVKLAFAAPRLQRRGLRCQSCPWAAMWAFPCTRPANTRPGLCLENRPADGLDRRLPALFGSHPGSCLRLGAGHFPGRHRRNARNVARDSGDNGHTCGICRLRQGPGCAYFGSKLGTGAHPRP